MAWFRVEGAVAFGAKHLAAGNEAVGAWTRAGAWCVDNLTDGYIPMETAHAIAPKRVWKKLVDAKAGGEHGLAEEKAHGYQLHDYLTYNYSAETVRAKKAAAGKLGGVKSGESRRNSKQGASPVLHSASSDASSKPEANGSKRSLPSPSPSPSPLLTTPSCAHEANLDDLDDLESGRHDGPVQPERPNAPPVATQDAPNHAPPPESPALPPSRPGNGQSDAGSPPGVAAPSGPDLLTMAHELAEAGNAFGRKMVDHAALARTFSAGQRETIRKVYAEHVEGQANAERARAAKAELASGPSTSRSVAAANQRDEQAMALWCELWAKQHRENYPVSDRDFNAMRKMVTRAESRARELGGETRVSDVLNHFFVKYLRISDNKLVSERYPLPLLESRLPAIGEYRPQHPKTHRPPEPEPEFAPPPPGFGAMIADMFKPVSVPVPRSAGGRS